MALCLLECSICQQDLLGNVSTSSSPPTGNVVGEVEEDGDNRDFYGRRITNPSASTASTPVSTSCGHLFHRGCILRWFQTRRHFEGHSRWRGSCPVCRKTIAYYNLVRVYLTPAPESMRNDSDGNTGTPVYNVYRNQLSADLDQNTSEAPSPQGSSHSPSQSSSSRSQNGRSLLYNNLFDFLTEPSSRGSSDIFRVRRRRRRAGRENDDEQSYLEIGCENPDCIDLRKAFQILAREFKTLQRRLDLEMDVSKMKTVLVTSQQREINELKTQRGRRFTRSGLCSTFGIAIILSLWLLITIYAIFTFKSLLSRFGRSNSVPVV